MSKPTTTPSGALPKVDNGEMDLAVFEALTDDDIAAAVTLDPDAAPVATRPGSGARRITPSRFLRHRLAMSQQAFAKAFEIPLATLQAWERHENHPTEVELAYLRAIARNPEAVRKLPERV